MSHSRCTTVTRDLLPNIPSSLTATCAISILKRASLTLKFIMTLHLLVQGLFQRLTNKLTPWRRILLEKLTVPQLVNKFPAFYGIQKHTTVFTKTRHLVHIRVNVVLNLSSYFLTIRYNTAHSSTPISTKCSSAFPIKPFFLFSTHAIRPTNLILLDLNASNVW